MSTIGSTIVGIEAKIILFSIRMEGNYGYQGACAGMTDSEFVANDAKFV